MKKTGFLFFVLIATMNFNFAQTEKRLLVRCDDIGMCHSVNIAAQKIIEKGIPFSASVMFTCPWYLEGAEILEKAENVSIGIHLTLNAEWKNYKWGPVAGACAVPSLIDSCGNFYPSRASLYDNNPGADEIEMELRSQIYRALSSGLKIDYVDYHMGTAVDKPEYRRIVEQLAKEFGLGISRYFGEEDIRSMYAAPYAEKLDSLMHTLENLEAGKKNLLVCHIGLDNPEMQAMRDENQFGLEEMSKHRNAELNALLSDEFLDKLKTEKIELITYKTLIDEIGLQNMKSPVKIENGIYK